MTEYRVRDASTTDLREMAAMAADLVRFHYEIDPLRYLMPRHVEDGYHNWFKRELKNADAILLVAEHETSLVGYAYGRIEERDWNMLLAEHAALHDIMVRPAARRGGVGSMLIQEFCKRASAKNAPRIVLHTAYSNQAAQALFVNEGFRPTMVEMTRELRSSDEPSDQR